MDVAPGMVASACLRGHTMLEAAQVAHNLSFIPFLLIASERDERSVVCTVHAVPAWELS
jgi:hypothetical protein